jgi:NADPH:quinone reductase-like Zn-dependent oxidoreductase
MDARLMRAARFHEYGDFEVVRVDEVPDPSPRPGEVLISVRAAGVNPIDWKLVHGFMASVYPLDLPAGLGNDAAGVVEQIGDGVDGFAPGQEVLGSASAPAFAERTTCSAEKILLRPAGVAWEVAGSLAVVVGTAYKTLKLLELEPGETLLLHAASGGVGMAALQLAVARGIRVVGTASEAKQELVRSLGGTPVVYGDGLAERVREVAPEGIDAVLDASGHNELAMSVELAGGPQRVLTIAASDAAAHGVRYHGGGGGEDTVAALREVLPLIEAGSFSFPIAGVYGLGQVGDALRESEHGHPQGKLAIVP